MTGDIGWGGMRRVEMVRMAKGKKRVSGEEEGSDTSRTCVKGVKTSFQGHVWVMYNMKRSFSCVCLQSSPVPMIESRGAFNRRTT